MPLSEELCTVEPIAFLHDRFLPADELRLPYYDLGVVGGVAVSEMLRTFSHRPFAVTEHLTRLRESLQCVPISEPAAFSKVEDILRQVVAHNTGLIDTEDDLGVILFVTAGWNPTYVGRAVAGEHGSTLGLHTFPLQYGLWSRQYREGVRLVISSVPAIPEECVDRRVKSRSRLHWYRADQAARQKEPGAMGLVLDSDGCVTETAAANIIAVIDGCLFSPPVGVALEGVSLQTAFTLAAQAGLESRRQPLKPSDLHRASEILLTSTPSCVVPVVQFEGLPVGNGKPGPVFRQLLQGWKSLVGCDFEQQALSRSSAAP